MDANTYWKVESLVVNSDDGVNKDVVTCVAWSCTAKHDNHEFVVNGNKYFTASADKFVPFDELRESEVLGWCWAAGLSKSAVEDTAKAGLMEVMQPKETVKLSPWKPVNANVVFAEIPSLQPNP